jgi:calcineurin-like phosphoesterase family protein
MVFFSSDFHLGHKVITKYRTQFGSIKEHDECILDSISKLTKRQLLYINGDFIFESPLYEHYLQQINKMPCRIKVIMGNHDNVDLYKQTIAKNIEIQLPLFSYKNIWVSHCPIHPKEIRGRLGNIHGHLHGGIINDPYYFNVNLDNNNFKFVPFELIKEQLEKNKEQLEKNKE